jgi:two-component system NtrC family sensor kinase
VTPAVLCAPQELKQLFLNLLINAASAVGDCGVVRVSSEARDGRVLVRIQDDGCGMEPERVGRLFDPVFDRKTTGGFSIGLPACYEIVRKHGGAIRVESEEGRGTTFHVELPAAGPGEEEGASSDRGCTPRYSAGAVSDAL